MRPLKEIDQFEGQNIRTGAGGNEFLLFDRVENFIKMVEQRHFFRHDGDDEWTGGTVEDALKYSVTGDPSLVPEAQKRIDKLQTTLPDLAPSWSPDIVGDMVCVPEFIVGVPEHMRRKIPNETASAPIRVVFDTMSGALIKADDLVQRGVSVLALLMRLIVERPVEFWVANMFSTHPEFGIMVRVPTAPLNLGMAAFLLTNGPFTRNFMYQVAHRTGDWDGAFPAASYRENRRNGTWGSEREVCQNTRRFFGLEDTDLVIPLANQNKYPEIFRNSVNWINTKLNEGRVYVSA